MTAKAPPTRLRASIFETELGWAAMLEGDRGVSQLTLAHANPRAALAALEWSALDAEASVLGGVRSSGPLVRRIQAFARGRYDDFLDVPVDTGRRTLFQQRVELACRQIPPGQTRSYGELAEAVGAPRAARAVGSVMASTRMAILVPCHRVVRSGGGIADDSRTPPRSLKQRLLALEQQMLGSRRTGTGHRTGAAHRTGARARSGGRGVSLRRAVPVP